MHNNHNQPVFPGSRLQFLGTELPASLNEQHKTKCAENSSAKMGGGFPKAGLDNGGKVGVTSKRLGLKGLS